MKSNETCTSKQGNATRPTHSNTSIHGAEPRTAARSSTFSPYKKKLPNTANTPTSQKSQFHYTNQSHLPFLISFSHSLNSHIDFFSFSIYNKFSTTPWPCCQTRFLQNDKTLAVVAAVVTWKEWNSCFTCYYHSVFIGSLRKWLFQFLLMLLLMLYVQETQPVQKLFILMVFNKRYVTNSVFFGFFFFFLVFGWTLFGLASSWGKKMEEKWAMFSWLKTSYQISNSNVGY